MFKIFTAIIFCLGMGILPVSKVIASEDHKTDTHQHSENHSGEEFNISNMLFHHILDAHEWHLTDIPTGTNPDGSIKYTPIALRLPYIIYHSKKGLTIFTPDGHSEAEIAAQARENGYSIDHFGNVSAIDGSFIIDFSITKTVVQMMLIAVILILVFSYVARAYTRNPNQAPKGLQSLVEPVILFVRDEICKPNLHGKHEPFVPYMLTLFFFIWFSNLLGLTPLNSNIAGNISVTAALAVLTFLIVQFNGTKDYWQHIFWFPGVPLPVKFIMLPVELLGIFTKPFSLCMRLFANIAAGHFMTLSLVGLIFLMSAGGKNIGAAMGILPLSLIFGLIIMTLEVLVAVIQAYVFTLLTCVFIGQAMESHHHNDHHHAADKHGHNNAAHKAH
jgi:F-type H+-transporting ATPase subunit a